MIAPTGNKLPLVRSVRWIPKALEESKESETETKGEQRGKSQIRQTALMDWTRKTNEEEEGEEGRQVARAASDERRAGVVVVFCSDKNV